MAPLPSLSSLARRDGSSASAGLSPVYIVGIVLIVIAGLGLVGYVAWKKWKERQPPPPEQLGDDGYMNEKGLPLGPRPTLPNSFNRARVTASIVLPAKALAIADSAAGNTFIPPMRPHPRLVPASPDRPVSLAASIHTPPPASPSRLRHSWRPASTSTMMAEHEILDYHLSQGTMPMAFAPIAIGEGRAPSSRMSSVTASVLEMVETEGRSQFESGSTVSSLPWRPGGSKPGSQRTHSPSNSRTGGGGHSRFSSFAASIRFPGGSPPTSPAKSIFTFGKKHQRQISHLPSSTPENRRSVQISSFSPLLPDELVIRVGESLTVVEEFDDEWCIVARLNLGMLEVGAVPKYVFGLKDGEDETFGTMRPMRSTSLGVTVDLRVIEAVENGSSSGPAAPGRHWAEAAYRDSVISWSNF